MLLSLFDSGPQPSHDCRVIRMRLLGYGRKVPTSTYRIVAVTGGTAKIAGVRVINFELAALAAPGSQGSASTAARVKVQCFSVSGLALTAT